MPKKTAIFFLLLFMAYTTDAGQLARIPLLVNHYFEHLEQGRSSSFAGFLHEHYFSGHAMDQDQEKDRQLPFKEVREEFTTIFYSMPQPFSMEGITPPPAIRMAQPQSFILSRHAAGIFHPPRQIAA